MEKIISEVFVIEYKLDYQYPPLSYQSVDILQIGSTDLENCIFIQKKFYEKKGTFIVVSAGFVSTMTSPFRIE